ncbi:MAG: hypothetical protein FJ211_06720 [Ignavibacteria bacterium]|nr:hypothetical protein [Ignavibacteria bacterium]
MYQRYASQIVVIATLILVAVNSASAQKRKIPSVEQMLNTGSQGTEFWIAIPPNEINPYPVDELEIYVASAFDTDIEVYDAAGEKRYRRTVKSYEVRTLSDDKGETNWTWELREPEQVVKKGVRITAKKPISVYVLNSKAATSDGYMAIPVNGWGTEYMCTSYYDMREYKNWAGGFVIIAREQCQVDVLLRGTGAGSATTALGKKIGERFTLTMDEGDVYMIHGDGQTRGEFDLSGSLVKSSAPIGFISFHMRTTMPNLLVNGNGRNHLVEMTPPITTWGRRYVSVELQRENRNNQGKGDVFRVFAKEGGTQWKLIYYDKVSKKILGQGGGLLQKDGEFTDIAQTGAPTTITHGYSVWTANKPIFVMQYSCSQSWDGDPILDPFMINVTPEEQFLTSTIFQFPTAAKFTKHRLNLIVKTDTSDPNYIDNLKSLEIDDIPVWKHPQAQSPTLLFTKMPNGLHWTTLDFGNEPKAHKIKSNGLVSFGGYIYGFGFVDAYGWPAAAGFKPTTSVDTLPPVIKGDSLCGDYTFTATELRNIPDPPLPVPKDTDQVETGIALIDTLEGANSYNYELELITDQIFPQNPAFKKFEYAWKVIDKSKDAYCVYFVADWAGNITLDTCRYFADKLVFTPAPLSFGKIKLGTNKTAVLTITNNSDAIVKLTEAKIKAGTYFAITIGNVPPVVMIPAKGKHDITIQYNGTRETSDVTKDWDKDTIIVKTECGEFKHPLGGVAAIPRIKVKDFDAQTRSLNEKYCAPISIENPGSDTLVVTSLTGYQGTNFSLSTPFTPALPIVVLPRQTVELKDVCFQSATITDDNINVTLTSNGEGPDSVSNWRGNTQTPGPGILGYDWGARRVNTLHAEWARVYNTGNQKIVLNDVTFADGTKYWPAGSNDNNFVFKIGSIFKGGVPVQTADLIGDTVRVEVFFRPATDNQPYLVDIKPVWADKQEERTAKLGGEGILPKINSQPVSLTCTETPEFVEATRDITITNGGTMLLTVSGIQLQAPVTAGYRIVNAPATPLTVPANGGTAVVTLGYTRPAAETNGSSVTIEFTHDATPGTGKDATSLTPVGPHAQVLSVGQCGTPDFDVTNWNAGRARVGCDQPEGTFDIKYVESNNTSDPVEINSITKAGADQANFDIIGYLDNGGQPVALPLVIAKGQTFQARVRFNPNAVRAFSAQFTISGFVRGNSTPLQPKTVNVTGVGYTIPLTFNLTNDMNGQSREPGKNVAYTVDGQCADWTGADVKSLTATVIYNPKAIAYNGGSVRVAASMAGWNIADPTVVLVSDTEARMTFTATGATRVAGNGPLFTFDAQLLLAEEFKSAQNLEVLFPALPCLIPATTGTGTEIFNCAITRRVVDISTGRTIIKPISPNPVTNGSARVEFGVGIAAPITIDLVNAQGLVVRTFVNNTMEVGSYDMTFSTEGLAQGAYFLRMRGANYNGSQRVVIGN